VLPQNPEAKFLFVLLVGDEFFVFPGRRIARNVCAQLLKEQILFPIVAASFLLVLYACQKRPFLALPVRGQFVVCQLRR
jgi:hypothetical protein